MGRFVACCQYELRAFLQALSKNKMLPIGKRFAAGLDTKVFSRAAAS